MNKFLSGCSPRRMCSSRHTCSYHARAAEIVVGSPRSRTGSHFAARWVSASARAASAESRSMGWPVVSRFLVSAIRRHSRTMCLTASACSEYTMRRLSSQRMDWARRQRARSVMEVMMNVVAEPSRTPAMVLLRPVRGRQPYRPDNADHRRPLTRCLPGARFQLARGTHLIEVARPIWIRAAVVS